MCDSRSGASNTPSAARANEPHTAAIARNRTVRFTVTGPSRALPGSFRNGRRMALENADIFGHVGTDARAAGEEFCGMKWTFASRRARTGSNAGLHRAGTKVRHSHCWSLRHIRLTINSGVEMRRMAEAATSADFRDIRANLADHPRAPTSCVRQHFGRDDSTQDP